MKRNRIKSTLSELIISLYYPTKEMIDVARNTIHAWKPIDGATVRIHIALWDSFFALTLRTLLLRDFPEQFPQKPLIFNITFCAATEETLDQFFKGSKAGKTLPQNTTLCSEKDIPETIWTTAICKAVDNKILSDSTTFYMNYAVSPRNKDVLCAKGIAYVDREDRTDEDISDEDNPRDTTQISSSSYGFFNPSFEAIEAKPTATHTPEIEIDARRQAALVHISNALELVLTINAPDHHEAQDEIIIRRAFEEWRMIRDANLILNVTGLDTHWGNILRSLLLSERCLQTFQTRKVAFTIKFQQADDEGLLAFFRPDEKAFPQNMMFICDNTTCTFSWYAVILEGLTKQRFSESTAFDMRSHKFSSTEIYTLTQRMKQPSTPRDLHFAYLAGRASKKTISSLDFSTGETTATTLGYLPKIEEKEEENSFGLR